MLVVRQILIMENPGTVHLFLVTEPTPGRCIHALLRRWTKRPLVFIREHVTASRKGSDQGTVGCGESLDHRARQKIDASMKRRSRSRNPYR